MTTHDDGRDVCKLARRVRFENGATSSTVTASQLPDLQDRAAQRHQAVAAVVETPSVDRPGRVDPAPSLDPVHDDDEGAVAVPARDRNLAWRHTEIAPRVVVVDELPV